MAYEPLKHQIEDSDAMLEYEHAYLWADPGTGKTVTAMEAFRKGGYDRMVVVCPKIALDMWKEELHKHLGVDYGDIGVLRSGTVPSNKRVKGKPFALRKVIITTTDLIVKHDKFLRDFAAGLKLDKVQGEKKGHERPRCVLVVDEAHKFKSVTAKRSIALQGKGRTNLLGLSAQFTDVWQLTGTPITRHADDLFMQLKGQRFEILQAYNVETYKKFINEFCETKLVRYHPRSQLTLVVIGSKNLKKLENLLSDCKVIRRKLADVWDEMPDITYRQFTAQYKKVPNIELPMDPTEIIRQLNDPDSMMTKIYRVLGLAKVPDVVLYLTDGEVVPHHPVLVGCWHRDVIEAITEELTELGYKVAQIHGGTGHVQRKAAQDDFNAGRIDFLVGQVKAMGEAISLQERSRHVVLAEQLASPSDLKQFVARVMRRGQKNHVQVDMALADHDLDNALLALREAKRATIERVS